VVKISWADFFKEFGKSILQNQMDDVKTKVKESIEETVDKVVKSLIITFIALVGFVLALAGIAKFLSERVDALSNGLGYLLIGVVLLLLAMFARAIMPKK